MNDLDTKAATITKIVSDALRGYMDNSSRSQQSAAGILGPSDIGFCRQKAVLMTRGVTSTDTTPKWAAAVGTALHNYIEAALHEQYPDWLFGSIDNLRVTAKLPSGSEISGHPDIVVPASNTVLDIKTVDGFEYVKREGTSLNHKYQRHLYALGCAQSGLIDPDKTMYVGNIYFDRSGKEETPLVLIEEFSDSMTSEIDQWVQDVIYAVQNNEDASRDIPAPVCERICSHFAVCRGELEIHEDSDFITHPDLVAAIEMYMDGSGLVKDGDKMKREAKSILYGVNGRTDKYQVRWVEVGPSRVEATERDGYTRMDIRKVRS